jgi:hypothetical protein
VKSLWDRWSPLTGALSVACSLVGVMFALGLPQDSDTDAKIAAYFDQHSHRVQGSVGFFVSLAGILLLLVFFGSLRERLLAAEGATGRVTALVFGAGVASLPLWGVSTLFASGAAFTADHTSRFRLDPNTFRLFADMTYFAWVAAVAVSVVVVWGTSVVALRTGVLPRWYAQLGIAIGVAQLLGSFYFPFFVWWVWLVLTSVLLAARRSPARSVVAQPAV